MSSGNKTTDDAFLKEVIARAIDMTQMIKGLDDLRNLIPGTDEVEENSVDLHSQAHECTQAHRNKLIW